MPRIVLDTSISLPATLSPRGLTRKLLVLLAYGTLNHRAEQRRIDLAALHHEDYLVSDDRDIVPDGSEHHYEHDGHNVLAVTFNRLMAGHFEPADLNWGEIDGRWLAYAYPLFPVKVA